MTIYVDIDGTICSQELNYTDAKPLPEKIKAINDLYDQGNKIVYWTARGSLTGINWRPTTEEQFRKWGVKHHGLLFGKPVFDRFIDDRAINAGDI